MGTVFLRIRSSPTWKVLWVMHPSQFGVSLEAGENTVQVIPHPFTETIRNKAMLCAHTTTYAAFYLNNLYTVSSPHMPVASKHTTGSVLSMLVRLDGESQAPSPRDIIAKSGTASECCSSTPHESC